MLPPGKNMVAVVAHPDDEVLWSAGLMLAMPGKWTVICCSIPRIDPVRAWKFYDACAELGAQGRVLPMTESEPDQPLRSLHMLDLNDYDLILTHGAAGEYGHEHHKQVHHYIMARWAHKPIVTFGGERKHELSTDELCAKLRALKRYDHCLPYEGKSIPKWRALVHRYCDVGGYNLGVEAYDVAVA